MVDPPTHYLRPLDIRDPDFLRQSAVWAAQTQGEISALIEASKRTIADSRALMVDADRILAAFLEGVRR